MEVVTKFYKLVLICDVVSIVAVFNNIIILARCDSQDISAKESEETKLQSGSKSVVSNVGPVARFQGFCKCFGEFCP